MNQRLASMPGWQFEPYTRRCRMTPVFALVDCNNFYASCEKLFRPDLRHTPVVVLSNNDLRGRKR
jgi:G3E family GTPase